MQKQDLLPSEAAHLAQIMAEVRTLVHRFWPTKEGEPQRPFLYWQNGGRSIQVTFFICLPSVCILSVLCIGKNVGHPPAHAKVA